MIYVNSAMLFVLLVGATYRLWRLIAEDEITQRPRLALPEWLRMPVTCAWCSGSWLAIGVVVVVDQMVGLPLPLLWMGAVATGVGLIAKVAE